MDQILFLRNRASTKLWGCGTLVTSDHGEARFWDLFGPDEPLGSFPLTQNPEEQVVALSTDRENHVLLAGDTASLIAVFDVKDYCMVTGKVGTTSASLCCDKWNGLKDAFFSCSSVLLQAADHANALFYAESLSLYCRTLILFSS